ncbi:Riboflavin transporter [bacterium HR40]|nr:Riboflavin transporter [bacterium HR40]
MPTARSARDLGPLLRATLWMLFSLAALGAMAVGVRELSDTLGPFEILFVRSVIGVAVVALVVTRTAGPAALRSRQWGWQVFRHSVHFAAQVGWIVAIAELALAEVFAIEFTSPVWGALLAVLLLGERPTGARLFALACGLVGMLLVVRPGFVPVGLPTVAIVLAAIGFGFANVATKRLVATDHPLAIVFWMCATQALLALPPTLVVWVAPTFADLPWLLFVGLCGLGAHYALSRALQLADALFVLPIDFLRLPLIALVGFFVYGERLDPWTLGGGALIVAGVWGQLWWERSRPPRAA